MSGFYEEMSEVFAGAGLEEFITRENGKTLEKLCDMLTEANGRLNLTAICDRREILVRHFADSLTAAKEIPYGASLVDVGCGGGFPSLPLAIARPDLVITALDSTAKKLVFVSDAAEKLGLTNITVLAARAEELDDKREVFDAAVSRAVARMNMLCELCMPLVRPGGIFVAMKGAQGSEELDEARDAITKLGGTVKKAEHFTLSDAGERYIITVAKNTKTPGCYPRAWAKIKKSPL